MPSGARPEGGLLAVRVQPRARQTAIDGWRGAMLRVRVATAPDGGEATRAVIGLLAGALGAPPSTIACVRGAGSRDKLFRIGTLSAREVRTRLGGACA